MTEEEQQTKIEADRTSQIKAEFERLFSKSDLSCDNDETSSFTLNICGDMGNTLAYDNVEIHQVIDSNCKQ